LEFDDGRVIETARVNGYDDGQTPIHADGPSLVLEGIAMNSIYSYYYYPIEGPTSYRHVLVSEDGTVMVQGNSPFFGFDLEPAYVALSR
jgi:hypothetical protein